MGSKLYIGNLNYATTNETLRATFGADGRTVKEAFVMTDQHSGRSRGFGFIELGSDEEAQAAKDALDGTEIDGRQVKVNDARDRNARSGSGGGFGGGGGGGYGGGGDRY